MMAWSWRVRSHVRNWAQIVGCVAASAALTVWSAPTAACLGRYPAAVTITVSPGPIRYSVAVPSGCACTRAPCGGVSMAASGMPVIALVTVTCTGVGASRTFIGLVGALALGGA